MPATDQERIGAQARNPRILRLWRALAPLRSCISFMNTGAHPDDETSSMLAALGLRDGLNLSYACANRGEGGQNAIGTEAGMDLGVVRTAEMERAADILGLQLYWLSEHPEDAIFDFGFSKSGEETLHKWGRERTLKRMVHIVRTERPDIICPTFLDMPGQHGHHRAMTEIVGDAFDAAADPDFPGVDLPVWPAKKLYLPAWSGAGDSYDDDFPPPPATLTVAASGEDPVTGWSWAQTAEQSRVFHRTQGMGRWLPHDAPEDWPLHLAMSRVAGPDVAIAAGLPMKLRDLSAYGGAPELEATLLAAGNACEDALAGFPDRDVVARHAAVALKAVRHALQTCPEHAIDELRHRLVAKERQLGHVLRIACGVEVQAVLERDILRPGETVELHVESTGAAADILPVLPVGWHLEHGRVRLAADVPSTDPYPVRHDPLAAQPPAVRVRVAVDGVSAETMLPFEPAPVVLPARSAALAPDRALINLAAGCRSIDVQFPDLYPADAVPALNATDGWTSERAENGVRITAPVDVRPGLYRFAMLLDGKPAETVRRFSYPHIGNRARTFPADLSVRVLDVAVPDVRIGYVGGGNDRVCHWLGALGANMVEVTDEALKAGDLAALDTLVVGIFALGARPTLLAAMPLVHDWVEAGGNLVTLYHRPWDAWDPDAVPPRRLEIGKPSLRWRVTDETAEVTCLDPGHRLLNAPNRITGSDWQGWHKERGLYFAKSWDKAYRPLLSMADPAEKPHQGALLSARIGKGRHTHVALILHHQMDALVPGAFRLMANLVAGAQGSDMPVRS